MRNEAKDGTKKWERGERRRNKEMLLVLDKVNVVNYRDTVCYI